MNSKIIANGIIRAILILAAIILFGYFLYAIQSVLIYIAIAIIVSLIARPLILFLRKKLKFPNTIAVIITMVVMLSFLIGLIFMFIPLVVEQSESLSLLDVETLQNKIKNVIYEIDAYFSIRGFNIIGKIKNIDFSSKFIEIPNLLNAILGMLGSFSIGLFSVLFISFFFMKDSNLLKKVIIIGISKKSEIKFLKSLETINNLLSRYFIGLIFQITILFVIYTIILLSFGISNAIVISFLCALLNLIPYLGPLVSAIIMFVLSMTSNIGLNFQMEILPTSTYIMIFYMIAQLIDNFISQPLIFSKTTKSHPLEIFLIIIIGGLLFGVIGMIIAVPTYTAIKVILKEFLSENKIVKSLTKNI